MSEPSEDMRATPRWDPPRTTVGYAPRVPGKGALPNQIARLISYSLARAGEAGLCREVVAERMSARLGRTISKHMLDKYASEASEDHRIPFEAFVALVHATEDHELLGFLPSLFGFAVVPARYTPVIDLHLLERHSRELAEYRAALVARMGDEA